MKRKLTSLTICDFGKDAGKWNIHFSYYDEHGKWLKIWDEAIITEEELYQALKLHFTRKSC